MLLGRRIDYVALRDLARVLEVAVNNTLFYVLEYAERCVSPRIAWKEELPVVGKMTAL